MKRVTGIGGLFIKAKDPQVLAAWYQKHLGIAFGNQSYSALSWKDDPQADNAVTVFSFFGESTQYFEPSKRDFMFNFRVLDLDNLLITLRDEGVRVMPETETMEGIGKFGWILDPEGNKVELWEPVFVS